MLKAEIFDRGRLAREVRELRIALRESVKLQAHYARLLNQWDGGQRMIFDDSAAWIARLRETKTLPPNPALPLGGGEDYTSAEK